MIRKHTIRTDSDATRATEIQPEVRRRPRRPRVRRVAVILTDGSGFSLAFAPGELAHRHRSFSPRRRGPLVHPLSTGDER
jgi:hypothetical protein